MRFELLAALAPIAALFGSVGVSPAPSKAATRSGPLPPSPPPSHPSHIDVLCDCYRSWRPFEECCIDLPPNDECKTPTIQFDGWAVECSAPELWSQPGGCADVATAWDWQPNVCPWFGELYGDDDRPPQLESPFNWCWPQDIGKPDCLAIPAKVAHDALWPSAFAGMAYTDWGYKGGGCDFDPMVEHANRTTTIFTVAVGSGKFWKNAAGFAFFGTNELDGALWLGWSGTDFTNPEDVFEDFSTKLSKVSLGGRTYEVLDAIFKQFDFMIRQMDAMIASKLTTPGTKITVVGHSLGGAKAQLAAVYLANKYKASVRLVTFCSVRVFGTDSARQVFGELIQPVHGSDTNFGVGFPGAGLIAAQRWIRVGDFAPGYLGNFLAFGKVEHISRGLLVSQDWFTTQASFEYVQRNRNYAPWNAVVTTFKYHLLGGMMWALNQGQCWATGMDFTSKIEKAGFELDAYGQLVVMAV